MITELQIQATAASTATSQQQEILGQTKRTEKVVERTVIQAVQASAAQELAAAEPAKVVLIQFVQPLHHPRLVIRTENANQARLKSIVLTTARPL